MKKSAMQDDFDVNYLKPYGYIPRVEPWHSVAKTLEYAYDGWCIAQMAKKMGKTEDFEYFSKRAEAYQFNPDFDSYNAVNANGNGH